MERLNLKFEISDEEIRRLNYPFKTIQSQLIDKFIEFRKNVFDEIVNGTNGNVKQITIVKHASWKPDYSQVFYAGVLVGHLYEDFISFTFRFEPQKN